MEKTRANLIRKNEKKQIIAIKVKLKTEEKEQKI